MTWMNCARCQSAVPLNTAFCPHCRVLGTPERGQAAGRGFDLRRLSPAEQVVVAASLLIVLALFLPWFSVPAVGTSLSWSGITAHGYLALTMLTGLGLPGYLLLRAGWDWPPVRLPVRHAQLMLAGTGVQLILIVGGFIARPAASSWAAGAVLALAAALTACAVMIAPLLRASQPRC
jgi:hypothetical protein